jgi:ABC-type transport system substrate-binding protein
MQSEANDKPFFEITILGRDNDYLRLTFLEYIAEELDEIGINTRIDVVDSDTLWERWGDGDEVTPVYEEGGSDAYQVGWYCDWPLYECVPSLLGWWDLNFQNADMTSIYYEYYSTYNQSRQTELIGDLQQVFYDDLPIIPLIYHTSLAAWKKGVSFSEETINGMAFGHADGVSFTSSWSDLEIEGVSEIIISLGYYLRKTVFEAISWTGSYPSNLIWQGLYERDRYNNFEWTPLLAETMPEWNENYTVATVKLKENVTFADGVNFTAHDVLATYRFHLTPLISPGHDMMVGKFSSNDSIIALDDYTVQFSFNYPYRLPTAMQFLSFGIVPTHTYGNNTHPKVSNFNYNQALFDDLANGTCDLCFGTGPYLYTNFTPSIPVSAELNASNNYWKGEVKTSKLEFIQNIGNVTKEIGRLISEDIHIVFIPGHHYIWGDEWFVNKTIFTNNNEIITQDIPMDFDKNMVQFLGVNHIHPHLKNKLVREAISYAIPREKIIDEVLLGWAEPAATLISPITFGFNPNLQFHEYDIEKAKLLMNEAGYKIITSDPNGLTDGISPTYDDNNPLPIYFGSLLVLIVLGIVIKKKRNL